MAKTSADIFTVILLYSSTVMALMNGSAPAFLQFSSPDKTTLTIVCGSRRLIIENKAFRESFLI